MSATTERLLEEIKWAENDLAESKQRSDTVAVQRLEVILGALRKQLNQANEALNEGAVKVLKG